MQIDFLTSLISVASLVALAIPAFILRKLNKFPENAVDTLVKVLILVSQPFIIISSFLQKEYDPNLIINMGITLAISFAYHVILFIVARIIFLRKRSEEEQEQMKAKTDKVCVICSFMGNCGFMGIPVMKALFPGSPEMLMYTAVINISFNMTAWSLGIYTMSGNKKDMGIKKMLLNGPTLALIIGLPLFFFQANIIEVAPAVMPPIKTVINYLAEMTLPLSMLILGIRLAEMPLKKIFDTPKVYATCAVKLILSPLLCFGICLLLRMLFPIDSAVITTVFIVMAMPSAAITISFAEMYNGDNYMAVKCMLLSTILSVVTIPLLMLLCNFL